MTIQTGDKLPEATFFVPTAEGPAKKTTAELFDGRKVVLFGVPGAFTPTCHRNHLPGYIEQEAALMAAGVEAIYVTSVNDPFVMKAWMEATKAEGKIEFLGDGNGDFAKAIGLEMDGSGFGLGLRSKRYAMLVDDGVVKILNIEDAPSQANISSAQSMLDAIVAG